MKQEAWVSLLVGSGQVRKIALSHTRDPAEIPFGEHGAEYVCLDMTLSIIKSEKHTCRLCSVISPDVFGIESFGFDGCLIKHCLLDCFGQSTRKTGANPLVCSSPRRRLRVTWRPDVQFKDVQHERLQHVYTCICTCMVRNALSQYVVRTMYSS